MTHTGRFIRLTSLEAHLGTAVGPAAPRRAPLPDEPTPARAVFERALGEAIQASPGALGVLFSGGRDSSAVLAAATFVARRMGADDPLPVTAVYPDEPRADESEWQDLVLAHLGIRHRRLVEVRTQRRVLGARSTRHLRAHGLVWPSGVQTQSVFFDQAQPGDVFVTGEGGDLVLDRHRGTPLHLLAQDAPRVRRRVVAEVGAALAPNALIGPKAWREYRKALPWLRPHALRPLVAETAAVRGPLRWDRATRRLLDLRANQLIDHNTAAAASLQGVVLRHPLSEPSFVAALAREGGPGGFRGRTHLFRHLFGDLLPDRLLSRTTKASFNESRWGENEREFAAQWDGAGVDDALVDPVALRRGWLSERPHPTTFTLLQLAWLFANDIDPASGEARR